MSMFRSAVNTRLACVVGGAALSATCFMLAGAGDDRRDLGVPAIIDQEPVLFFDVSGFGIGGPLHSRLAVYSDGTVMVAEAGSPFDDGSACVAYVDPLVVRQLRADLYAAGAFTLTDQAPFGSDISVTTATVFQPAGNGSSRARTFSYTVALTPEMEAFGLIVQAFRDTNLGPTICSNDG